MGERPAAVSQGTQSASQKWQATHNHNEGTGKGGCLAAVVRPMAAVLLGDGPLDSQADTAKLQASKQAQALWPTERSSIREQSLAFSMVSDE